MSGHTPSRRALADLSHNVVLPASATDVMSLRKCPGREARLERATVATARQQEKLGRGAAPPRAGQSQCSTTRPRLQHTPPPQSKTSGGEKSLIDIVPPPPKSEIPRTPLPSSASLVAKVAKTPTIKATPTSPSPGTSTGRHGTPKEGTSTMPGPPSCTSCNSNGEVLVLEREVRQIPPRKCVTAENIARRLSAIPTAVTLVKGSTTVPGYVCDENDMAYLNRMRNVGQYERMQVKLAQLDRSIKAAAESKEQFEHQALKVEQDLRDMKTKYQNTVSLIQTLTTPSASTSTSTLSPVSTSSPPPPFTRELGLDDIAGLKRLHQHTALQLERSERELSSKLGEVEVARKELEQRLREQEAVMEEEEESREGALNSVRAEKARCEAGLRQATQEHKAKTAELCSLQSRLSQLRIASEKEAEEQRERREEEAEEKNGEAFLEEKRRAEQRLRRIICRCELYVQRHHMLKELGGRGRSLAPGAGQ